MALDLISVQDAVAFVESHDPHYARVSKEEVTIFIESVSASGRVFFDREPVRRYGNAVRLSDVRRALGY